MFTLVVDLLTEKAMSQAIESLFYDDSNVKLMKISFLTEDLFSLFEYLSYFIKDEDKQYKNEQGLWKYISTYSCWILGLKTIMTS